MFLARLVHHPLRSRLLDLRRSFDVTFVLCFVVETERNIYIHKKSYLNIHIIKNANPKCILFCNSGYLLEIESLYYHLVANSEELEHCC